MARTRTTGKITKTSNEKPVALTVRLDRADYRRLAALAARGETLRTHQEICVTAIRKYLDEQKA
jgi:predicted transcriptional regulator